MADRSRWKLTRFLLKSSEIMFILLLLCVAVFTTCDQESPKADLILENGQIYTLCDWNPWSEALAIQNGQILALGSNSDIKRFIGEQTKVLDLKGMFACPGFNDAYIHVLNGGMRILEVDLYGAESIGEIQRQTVREINRLPPGSWVVGQGWDQTLLPDRKWPTKRILDIVSYYVPIFYRRVCGTMALVNSKALSIAGIMANTPDPPGGEIVKDPETGEPNGLLKGTAMDLVSQYIPPLSEEKMLEAIELALFRMKQMGITSAQVRTYPYVLPVYRQLLVQGKLTSRISISLPLSGDFLQYLSAKEELRGDKLRFSALYTSLDGSMGSRTAFMIDPYLDDPTTRGIQLIDENDLNILLYAADQQGFDIEIKASGDASSRMAIDAFDRIRRYNRNVQNRHRIEDMQVIRPEDLGRLQVMNLIASVHPVQCIEDLRWIETRIGTERSRYTWSWNSLKNQGIILAFGTDWPVSDLNPMLGLYAAVARKDTSGNPPDGWFREECLTMEEALKAYTLGSAYAEGTEKEKGSIEPGKLADIVVLTQNLMNIPPEDILITEVIYTILGGSIVFQKEGQPIPE